MYELASDAGPNNVTGLEGWREMRAESVEVDFRTPVPSRCSCSQHHF
jgi:hypothetical protein